MSVRWINKNFKKSYTIPAHLLVYLSPIQWSSYIRFAFRSDKDLLSSRSNYRPLHVLLPYETVCTYSVVDKGLCLLASYAVLSSKYILTCCRIPFFLLDSLTSKMEALHCFKTSVISDQAMTRNVTGDIVSVRPFSLHYLPRLRYFSVDKLALNLSVQRQTTEREHLKSSTVLQDRQCSYKGTLRRVRVTIVAVKK
jgi:hypothetical protein